MAVKLYYFDYRGYVEPIRMILSYGGVEFEDIRIPLEYFATGIPPEIKEKCTWGQVPLVEFEGKKLVQSLAIARYFAKKFNLVGSNDFEFAEIDMYVDTIKEIWTACLPLLAMKTTNEEEKNQKLEEIMKLVDDKYLIKLNSIVENNVDGRGRRLVGKNITWADIYLASMINVVEVSFDVEIRKRYPGLASLSHAVLNDEPKIKEWMDKRPKGKY